VCVCVCVCVFFVCVYVCISFMIRSIHFQVPRIRMERKIKNVLGEDQLGFRGGKRPRDAIGMLKILSE